MGANTRQAAWVESAESGISRLVVPYGGGQARPSYGYGRPDPRQQARNLERDGLSLSDIVKVMDVASPGITSTQVRRLLKEKRREAPPGTLVEDLPPPTYAELHRHLIAFGAGLVCETAAGGLWHRTPLGSVAGPYLPAQELALLRVEADARGRFAAGPKRRRSTEETGAAVVALRSSGLVWGAIADQLGITEARARRLWATAQRSQAASPAVALNRA